MEIVITRLISRFPALSRRVRSIHMVIDPVNFSDMFYQATNFTRIAHLSNPWFSLAFNK